MLLPRCKCVTYHYSNPKVTDKLKVNALVYVCQKSWAITGTETYHSLPSIKNIKQMQTCIVMLKCLCPDERMCIAEYYDLDPQSIIVRIKPEWNVRRKKGRGYWPSGRLNKAYIQLPGEQGFDVWPMFLILNAISALEGTLWDLFL